MLKKETRGMVLGIAWSGGIGVVIALLTLIAGAGTVPRWAVSSLGGIGFLSFSVVATLHGWLKAPYWFGTPIRATAVLAAMAVVMFALCWAAWPPIRRHVLDEDEKARFKAPLEDQEEDRYDIELACPNSDEATCVYVAQFITLFREAGWKVEDNQVKRVTLGIPYDGIRLFGYVEKYPEPDAPVNSGVWALVSKSLIATYRSFHAIGIEAESGIRKDEKPNTLTVYFGSERADESTPTQLTQLYGRLPEVKRQYPSLKLP